MFFICLSAAQPINAANFTVNSTADAQDAAAGNGVCETAIGNGVCTLRAAITEANALPGDDTITLPAGTYAQSLSAPNENSNAGGDFDVTSNITINGAGAGSTFIEGNIATTERVIHFPSGWSHCVVTT